MQFHDTTKLSDSEAQEKEANSMTILYVDDDAEDIDLFQDVLKTVDPSIQYLTARNGPEALALLNNLPTLPDHVILDVNMPGMDGKACLQQIRKEKKFDGINVIVYSTSGFAMDVLELELLGATFVPKACSFRDLRELIFKIVDHRK